MKIAIWGTGMHGNKIYQLIEDMVKDAIEIKYFIETKPGKKEFLGVPVISASDMNEKDFDKLIVAVYKSEEIIEYLRQYNKEYNLIKEKIITSSQIFEKLFGNTPYQICNAEGIYYMNYRTDAIILMNMFLTGKNFSKEEMDKFLELSDRYYGKRDTGYFLDIGANIGTTSIYIYKKRPSLKFVDFECGRKNYDMLRVNTILNHCEDIKAEWLGLSNIEKSDAQYIYIPDNAGGSQLVAEYTKIDKNMEVSEVKINTLDYYLKANNIGADEIAYIWIDTEGHDAEVILGAQETIKHRKIPLMQEFTPGAYKYKKLMHDYVSCLETYSGFIDVREYITLGKVIEYPISQLKNYDEKMQKQGMDQTDLFFF